MARWDNTGEKIQSLTSLKRFAMTWDFDQYDQFIRRVRRQGQKSKQVFVHHILARNTVDVDMLYALKSKRRGQDALFEALKSIKKGRKNDDD